MIQNNLKLHIGLFFVTFLSLTYRDYLLVGLLLFDWAGMGKILQSEWTYSLSLILILLCHEMGHYIPARFYGVKATLPYFIPFPIGPIGTMGAVIQIKEPIPDKIKLFDIGVGGPLMSLILSVPCWIGGLYLSKIMEIDSSLNKENFIFFGDSIFTYWTGQWILGPYDPQFYDIQIHPLAKAGWVGLIITAINLLPFGQLDGGHIIYSLFGERYRTWIYFLFFFFLIMAFVNFTWLVWGFLIYFLIKIEHPYIPDHPFLPLSRNRKLLGYFMLLSFIFIFVPVPIQLGTEIGSSSLIEDLLNFLK